MKNTCLLFFAVLFFQANAQKTLSGQVLDQITGEKLAYVNIGIIGKNIGTVSGFDGGFELMVEKENEGDTIRFSMIGYEPLEMTLLDFMQKVENDPIILLKQSITELNEIVVTDNNLKEKVLGNKTRSDNVTGGFSTDLLGNEVGVVMKIKRKPTYIKDFNCFIAVNRYGKLKFRLNIYEMENGMPGKNILRENIFVETEIEKGLLTVDLTKYNIWVEKDFLVSLEWIEDLGTDGLYFSARLLGAPMIARETSQGTWGKISVASLGFHCTVRY